MSKTRVYCLIAMSLLSMLCMAGGVAMAMVAWPDYPRVCAWALIAMWFRWDMTEETKKIQEFVKGSE